MPEAVQRDRRQVRRTDQPGELVGDVGRVQWTAVGLGEEQIALDPLSTQGRFPLVLLEQVRGEHQHRVRVDGDQALGRRCLGLALAGLPPVLDDLVRHLDAGSLQIGVRAALATGLAPPEAGVGDQVEQRVEPVIHGEVQELASLLGRPHHHWVRNLARPPPLRHPLRRPELRLRPDRGRQLDQLGDVVGQQALIDCRTKDGAQGLLDPVQRGRSYGTLPLHRRDLLRVAAGPILTDQLVAFHDRLEHRVQVAHPQPVSADLAQVRPEVETDVGLVRAVHVPAHRPLLQRQKRIEHRTHERMLQNWSAGLDETTDLIDLGQRLLLRDQSREQVSDLAQGLVVVSLGDPEQLVDPVEPLLRVRRRLVPAATSRAAVVLRVFGQLDPEVPLPVPLVRQLRTCVTERLPVAVPAGTPPEHRAVCH
ncbi:hypothetical protein VA596_38255 [Amycolatopsis sp., V23-08]|uniref:Uncharacterized protein n=1 Tax=Amycolatopsis heterodermiae TaxID=3110235 RepID=A0ABU5RGL1_9PSEU|nr:hypothetical protein [Amycolatopsis sp., V23-08]MEA5365422.1 hypothetical protein [Amycolatopsis sp., V23-08]